LTPLVWAYRVGIASPARQAGVPISPSLDVTPREPSANSNHTSRHSRSAHTTMEHGGARLRPKVAGRTDQGINHSVHKCCCLALGDGMVVAIADGPLPSMNPPWSLVLPNPKNEGTFGDGPLPSFLPAAGPPSSKSQPSSPSSSPCARSELGLAINDPKISFQRLRGRDNTASPYCLYGQGAAMYYP
jgi:hypothetical protein